MKKYLLGIVVLIVIGLLVVWTRDSEQTGIVPENTPPDTVDENASPIPEDLQSHIDSKSSLIRVTTPEPFDMISSPVSVSGEARGTWFFEASFPIVVTDWDGRIIGEGFATAQGEWMTEEFVPFSGQINFSVPVETAYPRGTLIFRKDNPSGLPEHDDALEIPVTFN